MNKSVSKLISEVVTALPNNPVIGWSGEWGASKVEVSRTVSFADRHRHPKWGKQVQKALGPNYIVTSTWYSVVPRNSPLPTVYNVHAIVLRDKKKKS